MLTEIIENDIKVQYLKKYCAQLRMQILYDDENRFYMGHEQREKFDETTKGKNLFKIKDVIREISIEIEKMQKEILNNALKERGLPELEEPLILQF